MAQYPGKFLNAIATAFVDEAVFRGIAVRVPGHDRLNPNLANLIQALVYALATRLGAPGRPWYMLVTVLAIGLAGGWLTGITGGIGAAFLGHSITRVAIFLTTGHVGPPEGEGDRGGGGRAAPGDPQGLAGARLGRGVAATSNAAPRVPVDPVAIAAPPVALYVHVPFCVSLCPYCDFVVYAGAAARGPRARVAPFVEALLTELDLRADAASTRRSAPGRPPLETRLPGRRDADAAAIRGHRRAAGSRPIALRARRRRRGHDRGEPRAGRARRGRGRSSQPA